MAKTVDDLNASVDHLSTDVQALTRETRARTRALWFFTGFTGLVLVIAIFAASSVLLSNRRALDESNRRWCPTVTALVPRPGDPRPTSERGRVVAEQFVKLSHDFGCD